MPTLLYRLLTALSSSCNPAHGGLSPKAPVVASLAQRCSHTWPPTLSLPLTDSRLHMAALAFLRMDATPRLALSFPSTLMALNYDHTRQHPVEQTLVDFSSLATPHLLHIPSAPNRQPTSQHARQVLIHRSALFSPSHRSPKVASACNICPLFQKRSFSS
ncbi:hypothetical protein L7F22_025084 [Adiantum nelumboides]|nr:hypothetical protein [Adiantum nelumboides]